MKKLTPEWLARYACKKGCLWFEKRFGEETEVTQVLTALLEEGCLDQAEYWEVSENERVEWANWLVVQSLGRENQIKYAIYAAEKALPIYEKHYPDDNRPRKAIEAAKLSREMAHASEDTAAYAAVADAAYAAARVVVTAAAADAAYAAVDAAAYPADAEAAADAAYAAVAEAAADAAYTAAAAAAYAAAADAADAAARTVATAVADAAVDAAAAAMDAASAAARAADPAQARTLRECILFGIGLLV